MILDHITYSTVGTIPGLRAAVGSVHYRITRIQVKPCTPIRLRGIFPGHG